MVKLMSNRRVACALFSLFLVLVSVLFCQRVPTVARTYSLSSQHGERSEVITSVDVESNTSLFLTSPRWGDDDKDWNTSVTRGRNILCRFGSPPNVNDLFTDSSELAMKSQGWKLENAKPRKNYDFKETTSLFGELGFSPNINDYTLSSAINMYISSQGIPPTDGYYVSDVNVVDGLIVAVNNASPKFKVSGSEPPAPVPPLNQWSDVAYLQWAAAATAAQANNQIPHLLQWVLRSNILNEKTLKVIKMAVARTMGLASVDGLEISAYPGVIFYMDPTNEEALALLGSPNGQGVGYMLLQHTQGLGYRRIYSITVFTDRADVDEAEDDVDDGEIRMMMLFRLV